MEPSVEVGIGLFSFLLPFGSGSNGNGLGELGFKGV